MPILNIKKNTIVHINNFARLGGIETTVIDFAKTFPQLNHVLLTISPNSEDLEFIKYLQNNNVSYRNAEGLITPQILDELNPLAILLHNTKGKHLQGEFPYNWLKKYRVIGVHHMATWPLVPADYDWFVSNWIRNKYRNCEKRMKNKVITLPPCIDAESFKNIKRPNRTPVIGRIQSGTWQNRGKWPQTFYNMLKELKNCEFLLVGSPKQEEWFKTEKIKSGSMKEYLSKIDIFVSWGNTTESWSKVTTEAIASGIPVVVKNNHDGLAEQIKLSKGGFLVNTKEEFIEKVQMLINNKSQRETIGKIGQEWVLTNASLSKLKSVFQDMLFEWSVA